MSEAEIIVSAVEKPLSFAGMNVSAMEMNASMKEINAFVSKKVMCELQKVRSALERIISVFQIILSNANQIISVTEIIIGEGGAAIPLIRWDLPAIRNNYFRDGKDPRRGTKDYSRNGKESVRDGKDPRRRIDNHLQDGKNRLADGLHSRCEGNNVREAIEDCRRNGNHYRRGFNKPIWIGNDRSHSTSYVLMVPIIWAHSLDVRVGNPVTFGRTAT